MKLETKIWFSITLGWTIKIIPLLIVALVQNSFTFWLLAITNIDLSLTFLWLNNGNVHSGESQTTLGHLIIVSIGYLSGLITYPLIIFVILTIWQRFKLYKTQFM